MRELKFLEERYPQAWVTEMIQLLLAIKAAVEAAQDVQQTCLLSEQIAAFEKEYDGLFTQGLQIHGPPELLEGQPKKPGKPKQSLPRNKNGQRVLDVLQLALSGLFYVPPILQARFHASA